MRTPLNNDVIHWFSAINSDNPVKYDRYIKMYLVAVLSAKATNPNVRAHLILDGKEDLFIELLKLHGVNIIHRKSSFHKELIQYYKSDTIALGAFLRIDIPLICEQLKLEHDYVLYTDNDVLLIGDISDLLKQKPTYFQVAGEFQKEYQQELINTGVMWISWKNMLSDHNDFVNFIKQSFHLFEVYDQDALKIYYKDRYTELDLRYNYKPYWGDSSDIKIFHFHGPKPTHRASSKVAYLLCPFFETMKKKFWSIYDSEKNILKYEGERTNHNIIVNEFYQKIAVLQSEIALKDARFAVQEVELNGKNMLIEDLKLKIISIHDSICWKITTPVRFFDRLLH